MQGLVPTSDQLEEMGREKTKVCVNDKELTPQIIFSLTEPLLFWHQSACNLITHTKKEVVKQDF